MIYFKRVVIEKDIDKQVRYNLFILKNNSWHITNSMILLVI